jgi:hypothetical protein
VSKFVRCYCGLGIAIQVSYIGNFKHNMSINNKLELLGVSRSVICIASWIARNPCLVGVVSHSLN